MVRNHISQYIVKGFFITTIKRGISVDTTDGEDEGVEVSNRHSMEVEENLKVPPPQVEETYVDTSAQNLQLQWKRKETMHEEHPIHGDVPMQEKYPMHGGQPSQEGTSSQGRPPTWFLEYFRKLNATMEKIEQRQEQILQNQEKQEKYIDRLEDLYENMYEQQTTFNQQCTNQMASIETQLEAFGSMPFLLCMVSIFFFLNMDN